MGSQTYRFIVVGSCKENKSLPKKTLCLENVKQIFWEVPIVMCNFTSRI